MLCRLLRPTNTEQLFKKSCRQSHRQLFFMWINESLAELDWKILML
ncbi:hypothetical protein NBRC111894_1627 [Sporolactobacillus inulinus]|uniref:Uncharacterized protein n=1 Tax=Sporolactobacillus inulinus TaxID=2078 RepID=A0A4Y1ZAW4_9BACL|nr:hypothetical protein NBRC111894_1627 [Sporolactobacillus inulinus]